MKSALTSAAIAVTAMVGTANANDIDTVRAFYKDILTTLAETTADRYYELFSPKVV